MSVDTSAKKAAYIARLVSKVVSLIDAIDELAPERKEWDELGYSSAITDDDMGNFHHINAADIASALTSIDAINALRAQGHGTNLAKMRP